MKKDEISRLLNRYLNARQEEKDIYFDADEVDELLNSLEEEDDYTLYDDLLALGLKLHPGNTDLLIRKSRKYIIDEDYEEALSLLSDLGDSLGQEVDLLTMECYASLNDYPKVKALTEKLIREEADYMEIVFEYISPLLNDLDMLEEAYEYIRWGLSLFPKNIILKEEWCFVLEARGEYEEAIVLCNELIDRNPYSFDYWFALGRIHSLSGEYDKAIEAFDFALTCDESEVEVKMLRAYCLVLNESFDKALEDFNDILEMNKEDDELMERLFPLITECYLKMDEGEKVYELLHPYIYGKSLVYDPTFYIHYMNACVMTGREEEAYRVIEKAALLFPENIRLQILFFFLYMEQKQGNGEYRITLEQIAARANALIATYESDTIPESLYSKGLFFMIINDIPQAIRFFEKAATIQPDMELLHIFLSVAYMMAGDEENSNRHLQQAPDDEKKLYMQMTDTGLEASFRLVNEAVNKKPSVNDLLTEAFFRKKENKN